MSLNPMNLNALFTIFDGLLGDIATFQGLQFNLSHGILIVDYVVGVQYEGEVVDGYVLDFVPFDELQTPTSYFALDIEGVKYIISEFILE